MLLPVALRISVVILPLLFGCSRGPSPQNTSPMPLVWVKASENLEPTNHATESGSGPYKVKTFTDVDLYAQIQDKRAMVTFAERKLVVEFDKERIVLDDASETKLPPGTKEVVIRVAGGKLSVTADGADVPRPETTK